jgi:hypothetical protein
MTALGIESRKAGTHELERSAQSPFPGSDKKKQEPRSADQFGLVQRILLNRAGPPFAVSRGGNVRSSILAVRREFHEELASGEVKGRDCNAQPLFYLSGTKAGR